jgi:hypothetical protein
MGNSKDKPRGSQGNKSRYVQEGGRADIWEVPPAAQQAQEIEFSDWVDINSLLVQRAQADYLKLAAQVQAPYSRELREIQQKTTRQLQNEHSEYNERAIFLDPTKFTIGVALGLSKDETVRRLLVEQNAQKGSSDHVVSGAAKNMAMDFNAKAGRTTTQFPVSYSIHNDLEQCVVVPAAEAEQFFRIKGLNPEKNREFTNRHEAWHCRDDRYTHGLKALKNVPAFSPSTDISKVPNDAKVREAYSLYHKKECVADVGALGDMIREGDDPKMIGDVIRKRNNDAWEARHFTSPVLEGFRREIAAMGVDKFRKLGEKQVQDFYYGVVDRYALSADGIGHVQQFEALGSIRPVKGEGSFFKIRKRIDEPGVKTAIDYRAAQKTAMREKNEEEMDFNVTSDSYARAAPPSPAEKRAAAFLKTWDAGKTLEDRAFGNDRKITPESLVRAYIGLVDECQKKLKSDPANAPRYEGQIVRLNEALKEKVQRTDYVTANLERGVKFEDFDPRNAKPMAVTNSAVAPRPVS